MICLGCGGTIGRECFNTEECEDISRNMAIQSQLEEKTILVDWKMIGSLVEGIAIDVGNRVVLCGEAKLRSDDEATFYRRENTGLADELAYWKHAACYYLARFANGGAYMSEREMEKALDDASEALEKERQQENSERYDVQPSYEVGS